MTADKLQTAWANRKHISLTIRQSERIRKGKKVPVLVDGQYFILQATNIPELFDASGKRLSAGKIKQILRKVR